LWTDPYERTLVAADQAGIRQPAGWILETDLVGSVEVDVLFAALQESAE